jgi:hypothetical protein
MRYIIVYKSDFVRFGSLETDCIVHAHSVINASNEANELTIQRTDSRGEYNEFLNTQGEWERTF